MTGVVWHRGDLRLHDHAALSAACAAGPLLGLVVLDPAILDATSVRRRALFYEGVRVLRKAYAERGGVLLVRRGAPWREIPALLEDLGRLGTEQPRNIVRAIHALRSYTPYGVYRDARTADALDVPIHWCDGLYVHGPGTILSASGKPYSVFSAYHRRWSERDFPDPLPVPDDLTAPAGTDALPAGAIPVETSDVELPESGEERAFAALETFIEKRIARYASARDRLDGAGGSMLSVYLTLGTLSARAAAVRAQTRRGEGPAKWLRELAWRDFMADMLHHRPDLTDQPFDSRWADFLWRGDEGRFQAWRDGETGMPVVDAAMRQLRATGWLSNRARMVAAQFLAKQLRVDWRKGERVFKSWLLDGDTASNVGNWQWAAGLGIDNAPYFRVFNPVTQGRAYDPDGVWLRRWAPESRGDPAPRPDAIVDAAVARQEYLTEARRVLASAG